MQTKRFGREKGEFMSIKVTYPSYMGWAATTNTGRRFFDEPQFVQDALNELFDGQEFEDGDDCNPDNVYANYYDYDDAAGVLKVLGDMLDFDPEHDEPAKWAEAHQEEIEDAFEHRDFAYLGPYLGHQNGYWYWLN